MKNDASTQIFKKGSSNLDFVKRTKRNQKIKFCKNMSTKNMNPFLSCVLSLKKEEEEEENAL